MTLSESELYMAYRLVSKISDARNAVLARDGYRCCAPLLDENAGPCFDAFGHPFGGYDPTGYKLEVDRVQSEPGSRKVRHTDVDGMYVACPGHHRGTGPNRGYVWATSHRAELRDHLRKIAMPDNFWEIPCDLYRGLGGWKCRTHQCWAMECQVPRNNPNPAEELAYRRGLGLEP